MSYTDYLRRQRYSYASTWLSFIHVYRANTSELYAFFEGAEDVAFYMPELRRRSGVWPSVRSFVCSGKRAVLKLVPVVRKKLDKPSRALFFVDKDLDDLLKADGTPTGDPFVFRTGVYSIENYLVSDEALRCVWTDLLQLPDGTQKLTEAVDWYSTAYNSALPVLRTLMAWILVQKKRGGAPNINAVNLNSILELRPTGRIRRRRDGMAMLSRQCGIAPTQCWRSVLHAARELATSPPKTFIRGKFELWIFVRLLEEIVRSTQSGGRFFSGTRPNQSVALTNSNAVTVLSSKLPTPSEVARFLDSAAALA